MTNPWEVLIFANPGTLLFKLPGNLRWEPAANGMKTVRASSRDHALELVSLCKNHGFHGRAKKRPSTLAIPERPAMQCEALKPPRPHNALDRAQAIR